MIGCSLHARESGLQSTGERHLKRLKPLHHAIPASLLGLGTAIAASAAIAVDNSSLAQATFREHKATYGLVYRLPQEVTDVLDSEIHPRLRERLKKLGLEKEGRTFNLPHVTVVHLHSADPNTPEKMLRALPKPPPVLKLTLKHFYNTEAAKGAGAPWWFDLGVVKSGSAYSEMMAYNTVATAALTPLRDGPLPRCTGPVYARMNEAARELTRTVGVSGVNVLRDGRETASHNPHHTLVYSMTPYDARLQSAMAEVAEEMNREMNRVLPQGIETQLRDISIVEIGFMGNVLREFYRISLENGQAWNVASGETVSYGK